MHMLRLEPHSPHQSTFYETAVAIVNAADTTEDIADLLAVAWHESRFNAREVGDGGASLGLFQIQPPTARAPAEELFEPKTAAKHAIRLLKMSRKICSGLPRNQRFAWYAAGGPSCSTRGTQASYEMSGIAATIAP